MTGTAAGVAGPQAVLDSVSATSGLDMAAASRILCLLGVQCSVPQHSGLKGSLKSLPNAHLRSRTRICGSADRATSWPLRIERHCSGIPQV